MVTCHLRYVIDPNKLEDFERYARLWMNLVPRFGGTHLGYFLPSEGANNIAVALFSFPSLRDYADYREKASLDPDCQKAFEDAERSGCIHSYERTFFRPLETA